MKKYIIIFILWGALYGCSDINDPERFLIESYRFNSYGDDQIAEASNFLDDKVGIKMTSDNAYNMDEYDVKFEVIKGKGTVESEYGIFDANSYALVNWELGSHSCEQTIRVTTSKKSGEIINETSIRAFGMRNNEWNEISIDPHSSIVDIEYDTINKNTYMVSKGRLFKQGEKYYQWEEMFPGFNSIRTIEFDNNGVFYAGTWDGKLFKSYDNGISWTACTDPINGRIYYFEFYITSDNCLWATAWDHGLHYSIDGGITWHKDTSGIENQEEMLDVYRFKNGTLVSLSRNKLLILKSEDGGNVWEPINTPLYTIKIYVTENDELIAINQDNGITIYKSKDMGQSYNKVFNVFPSWRTSPMTNNFKKYKDLSYVSIPGYGILTTRDFETFEIHTRNQSIRELFIDHNGVLIGKDWEWKSVSYMKYTEGIK